MKALVIHKGSSQGVSTVMEVGARDSTRHQLLTDPPEMLCKFLIVRASGGPFLLLLHKVFAAHSFQLGRGRQVELILRALLDRDHERAQKLYHPGHHACNPTG